MKVIYEFDPYEDIEELKTHQKASSMYCALWDLLNYRRDLYKGYKKFELEGVLQEIQEILNDSKVDED